MRMDVKTGMRTVAIGVKLGSGADWYYRAYEVGSATPAEAKAR